MQSNGSEERAVSNAMEYHNKCDSLPLGNTNEAKYLIYIIEDKAKDDQIYDEEISTDRATLSMDSRLRSSIEEPSNLELKTLLEHLEYVFLEEGLKLPVIIVGNLIVGQKEKLLAVLQKHKRAITWKIFDTKGINPSFCTHKILLEDDHKPSALPQWRLNPNMEEVVKVEVIKLLDAGIICPISESAWVSPVQVAPKKDRMTVINIERNELIPTRTIIGWWVCINYRRLNDATKKDHFPLPFID